MIAQDLRHAVRILATNPGFTIVAVLSLALGIGANTAIFSLVSRVLMSALPVRNPHEIVILTDPESRGVSIGSQGGERALLTYHGIPPAAGSGQHALVDDGIAEQPAAHPGPHRRRRG